MLEQGVAGVGSEMGLETVLRCTRERMWADSKAKEKKNAKENETVTIAARPDTFPVIALTSRRVRAKVKDSKGSATIVGSWVTPPGNAPRREACQKEKETVTKERANTEAGELEIGR